MNDIVTVAASLLAGGAGVQLVRSLFLMGKRKLEGKQVIADTGQAEAQSKAILGEANVLVFGALKTLIQPLREEIERLHKAHEQCEKENGALKDRVETHEQEINRLKGRL